MQLALTLISLIASGFADSNAFTFAHKAFANSKINIGFILLSLLSFVLGGIFYLGALWLKRDNLALPTIVEFLCWLVIVYLVIMITGSKTIRWTLVDHIVIMSVLAGVTYLAYRHGG